MSGTRNRRAALRGRLDSRERRLRSCYEHAGPRHGLGSGRYGHGGPRYGLDDDYDDGRDGGHSA